jgi:hypothetical protein
MAENLSGRMPSPSEVIDAVSQPASRAQIVLSRSTLRAILIGVGMAAVFIASLSAVQFATPALAGVDGYYHIRIADIMRAQGLKPAFPWLPLTILNPREYYDHHFLFHVALMPFTFGDLRMGAKWASVLFPALAFLSIWWLLRSQRVQYSSLWALGLLAISEAFIYRMSLVRAQSLSLAVMAIGLHCLLAKKYIWLIPLGFLYVWMYDAFPMLLVLAAIYSVSVLLMERRLEARPLVFSGLGIALGLIINPYFPVDIVFAFRHLLPKLTEATAVDVGSEWYPYNTGQLLENSPLTLVVFFAGVIALGLQSRRMETRTATSLLIAMLFGLMLFQSRRFIEYFPPFALIFAAFAWNPLLVGETGDPEGFALSSRLRLFLPQTSWRKMIGAGILFIFLTPGVFLTLRDAQASIKTSKSYTLFEGASNWLKANTPAGSRVFQTDWDDFPRLFYYNTHNTYLVGLDPTYMQLYNGQLYDLWVDITKGEVERPSEVIYNRFGARYVVSDLNHRDFIRKAESDPGLREVYRDKEAVIFALN